MNRDDWHNGVPNPGLRQGLFHFERIAPTARIARGASPFRFSRFLQNLDTVAFTDFYGEKTTLAQWLAASETDGYLVLLRGDIIMECYGNDLRETIRHNVMSVSKSFTGTLAALLIYQDALDPAVPVIEYVPELADSAYAGVTVEQVLNMTSGVAFNANTADPDSDVIRLTESIGWRTPTRPNAPRSLRAFLQSLTQRAAAPGAGFAYNDADTEVLAWVLERASGLRVPELLSREIWSTLGAEHDASISVDHHGVAVASAGLNLTLRDLGRFALMHLQEGSLGDRRILPAGVVRACRSGSRSAFANERNALRVVPGLGQALIAYNRQFWIFEKGYAMLGNNGQSVMILPDSELLAIKLSSIPNDKPSVIFHDQFNAYQAACALATKLRD